MLIIFRLYYFGELRRDILWRAEIKARHFLDDIRVQWQLQGFTVWKIVFRRSIVTFVHPWMIYDLRQTCALFGISDQHA
jgi:hypothetical protein